MPNEQYFCYIMASFLELYHGKFSRVISWQEQVAFDEMISALY